MFLKRIFNRSFLLLSFAAVVALGILLTLGSWQVNRLWWKNELIRKVEERISETPLPLENLVDRNRVPSVSRSELEYRPVTVTGRFIGEREFHYYATYDGKPGYHIYHPYELTGELSGTVLFINRGFVPVEQKNPRDRPDSLPAFDTETPVAGLFRWPDTAKPNAFTPDNDIAANIFFWRDLNLMIEESGIQNSEVMPFFVYENEKDPNVLPIGSVSIIEFPNNHLSYAITWYGLAATLMGVYFFLLRSRAKTIARSSASAGGG
ncbi:MAG: SURF1 family protein [Pseudomonadota bacterium]